MSNEQEQIDRERYNAEAEEAYRAEVEEDTPRMAERTDPWATVDEDHEGKCWMDDVNKARAADAALLRERDARPSR